MANLVGGDSDKKGNFYENKVVVSKFIDMLSGRYLYVQQESYIKNEECGVDIIVQEKDGSKTFYQCKSRNGINESWSISDLISAGIIKKALNHTREGTQYTLISPLVPCHTLRDFCYRAKTFTDLVAFESNAIGGTDQKKEYKKIKDELLKQINVTDEVILSFFNLFAFEIIPDDEQTIKRQLGYSAQIINTDLAYNLLVSYVETQKKVGSKISFQELDNYLKKNNVNFFSIDSEVDGKRISNLQIEFKDSLNRTRIKGVDFLRSETGITLDAIKNNKFTVLTGEAASGKSIISKQVCDLMDQENIVYLPINITKYDLKTSYAHFNQTLGFHQGIVRTISKFSPDKIAVLVLDQLDSIGWNSQMSSQGKDLCYSFVKDSLLYDNIHVLFIARNVEKRNIQQMVEYEQGNHDKSQSVCEVVVNKLTPGDISKIAPELSSISGIYSLLSTIGNIKLFLSLKEEQGKKILNSYDLINAFIESKDKDVILMFPSFNTMSFCRKLAKKMTDSGSFSVTKHSLFENSSEIISKLIEVGLISDLGNNRISFIHQIVFDFIIAQENYTEFEDGKPLIGILKRYNNNFLEKFETIKQFMEMLFRNNSLKFYDHIDLILFSKGLAFSIKRLALDFLNTVQNISIEHISLVDKIIKSKIYGFKYVRELSVGKIEIVEHLINNSFFKILINTENFHESAINILLSVQNSELAADFLKESLKHSRNKQIAERIIYHIDDIKSGDYFFNLKISLIEEGLSKDIYINWDTLLRANIDRTYRYLNLIYDHKRNLRSRFDISSTKNEKELNPLLEKYGSELHSLLKNYIFGNEKVSCKLRIYDFNSSHYYDNDDMAIDLFIDSINYQTNEVILSYFYSKKHTDFLKKAALINLIKLDISRANSIINILIEKKYLLEQNYYSSLDLLLLFEKIIKKLSNQLDDQHFNSLLDQILKYKRPNFIEHVKDVILRRKMYNIWINFWGEEQKRFLNCLPDDRLDAVTKNLKATLNRRFVRDELYSSEFRGGLRTYSVVSGVNKKNKSFTRKTWIKLLTSDKAGTKDNKLRRDNYDKNGNVISTDSHQFYRLISDAAYENRELFVNILLTTGNLRSDFVYTILDSISSRYSNKECKIESTPLRILDAHKLYYDQNNEKSVSALINYAHNYEIDDEWMMNTLLEISMQFENHDESFETNDTFDSSWQNHFVAHRSGAIFGLSKYLSYTKQKAIWFDDIYNICFNSNDLKVVISGVDLVYALCTFDLETGIEYFVKLLEKHPSIIELDLSLILIDHSISNFNKRYIKIIDSKWGEISVKGKSKLNDRLLSYFCLYNLNKKRVIRLVGNQNTKLEKNDKFIYTLSEIVDNNFNNQEITNRALLIIKILIKTKNRTTADLLFLAKKNMKFYHESRIITRIINSSVDRDDFDMRLFYLDDIFKEMPRLTEYADVIFMISNAMITKKKNYYNDVVKVINWLKTLYWGSKQDKIRQKALKHIDYIQMIYGSLI